MAKHIAKNLVFIYRFFFYLCVNFTISYLLIYCSLELFTCQTISCFYLHGHCEVQIIVYNAENDCTDKTCAAQS